MTQKNSTIFEVIKFVVELTFLLIIFGMFCFMLAMAPAIDAQILEWQGR